MIENLFTMLKPTIHYFLIMTSRLVKVTFMFQMFHMILPKIHLCSCY